MRTAQRQETLRGHVEETDGVLDYEYTRLPFMLHHLCANLCELLN
jgi:hypothetical protein